MLKAEENRLVFQYDSEKVWIEPWGQNSIRIRACRSAKVPTEDWALLAPDLFTPEIALSEEGGEIRNGKIAVFITNDGKIRIHNQYGQMIVKEFWRNRRVLTDPDCSALEVEAREFKPVIGGDYHLTFRMESLDVNEKIYGMGQYQQPYLNLKGTDMELAQRNSQVSVPFFVSSLGYGMLWNNPAIGRAVFGKNVTSFEAYSTKVLDLWFTAGDTPAEMVERYANVTGKAPMMPDYGLGFWQSKLRYQTQEELLNVAREYHRRGLPLDMIIIDYFHWPKQGEWRFDPAYWPDPDSMIQELKDMGIELMVSIWPTVDPESENYQEMLEKGYLVQTERGVRVGLDFEGHTMHLDVTNPEARDYLWNTVRQNYYQKGIRSFWLDEAEPEYTVYDFDNYRYYLGKDLEVGNVFPREYARTFYEGMTDEGQKNIVNLVRCAWAGSQRYGTLVWSGDIASSFNSMKNQLVAGLNMGIAGIPWWTTDIGGFHGGDPDDPVFRELFVRWFQWGTFCPVMRLHGDREPKQPQQGDTGGAHCCSGAPNEVWSYGEEVYEICVKYMNIRDCMREYTKETMRQAHEKGTPVMRTLFYMFPDDPVCWDIDDEYFYGDHCLVAPVFEQGALNRKVYLPEGCMWEDAHNKKLYSGGQWIIADAPLSVMPVFLKSEESQCEKQA